MTQPTAQQCEVAWFSALCDDDYEFLGVSDPQDERAKAVAAALDAVAQDRGVSRSVAAYSWLMAHPAGIVPIVGSQQPERIAEAAQVLTVRWTRQEWYAVLVAARGENLP